jgi:hypothetical protein
VSKAVLCDIATQYQRWVTARAAEWGVPLLDAPTAERRDHFVDRYFRRADPDHVVVILKAREPARYLVAIGKDDRWHLEHNRGGRRAATDLAHHQPDVRDDGRR